MDVRKKRLTLVTRGDELNIDYLLSSLSRERGKLPYSDFSYNANELYEEFLTKDINELKTMLCELKQC
jgi:hypothetical protein